ncbi:2-oxo acid dehydrogenase subunit E2 [Mycolicibacterium komossense]|uniref:Dihydrolipoamide acetyltransferase component of pyruvate dehydrogenase complex n=1 Tax=Mycolicibacterium komossense TaxID=1779 RepID=A0ABT3CJ36_9MYCO|nr:2-oxo acid dehydrogenase subunit E2 [Mycolicibacterium komossense]MCV7229472.1 2-oxo acid dehydrogenase subunit E2 [Mycolicibacterium komossense]
MPFVVTLPDLGESVSEATISRWLCFPGDQVQEGDPLLEVSTDKVDTEVSAPASGRLSEVLAEEGQVLLIGAKVAVIDQSVAAPEATTPIPPASAPEVTHTIAEPDGGQSNNGTVDRPYVTPLVRRLASEHGVDLSGIQGSGIGNRIRKADILAAAAASQPARDRAPQIQPGDPLTATNLYLSTLVSLRIRERGLDTEHLRGTGHRGRIRLVDLPTTALSAPGRTPRADRTEKLTRLRTVIATRMVESLRTSAQLTTVIEADVTAINELRKQYGSAFLDAHGIKLSFTQFFLRAAIDTLAEFPALNASIAADGETVTYHGSIHLNVAVDTDRGLLAPVIRDASTLNIAQIGAATVSLADRARTGKLSPDDQAAGTFTVTNTGSRGALFDTPIINQPQVAILGTGAVVARATVGTNEDGTQTIEIRDMAYFALTYDHRLIDGADAARFLTTLKRRLERAEFGDEVAQTLTVDSPVPSTC